MLSENDRNGAPARVDEEEIARIVALVNGSQIKRVNDGVGVSVC
jgi:hypothetical protein